MILDGKALSLKIRSQLTQTIQSLRAQGHRIPGLAVILVGDDPASKVYVHYKQKACKDSGIHSETHRYPASASESDIVSCIQELNNRDDIDGILLQLPLPKGLDSWSILQKIDPIKDVDGLHTQNQGLLCWNQEGLQPCTPKGVITLLKEYKINLQGLQALVVGRSGLVGRPLATLLTHENATVTLAHSHTKNLKEICLNMDLVVSAIGQPHFLKKDWFKPGVIIVDVGIHRLESSLCGDVDPEVSETASAYTPVPGGVGPMTIATLLSNCVQAWSKKLDSDPTLFKQHKATR